MVDRTDTNLPICIQLFSFWIVLVIVTIKIGISLSLLSEVANSDIWYYVINQPAGIASGSRSIFCMNTVFNSSAKYNLKNHESPCRPVWAIDQAVWRNAPILERTKRVLTQMLVLKEQRPVRFSNRVRITTFMCIISSNKHTFGGIVLHSVVTGKVTTIC